MLMKMKSDWYGLGNIIALIFINYKINISTNKKKKKKKKWKKRKKEIYLPARNIY